MNLVVDCGNTITKVGIFDQDRLTEKMSFTDLDILQSYLDKSTSDHFLVSSVKTDAEMVRSWIKSGKGMILSPNLPLPITNRYATPETLGADRIASACGAVKLFPNQNTLVIDAGTCITYDFVDHAGNYLGGGISPGINMRFKAIQSFTARLPLVEITANPPLVGDSTSSSIQSGVIHGTLAELDGIISKYNLIYPHLKVILTGGDSGFFENKFKASIFAVPELVLIGLNSILQYNVH